MKNKLIYSNFDPETGISTVTIQNKYGHFTGTAKLDEEDKKHPSKFQGCEYAESKAIIEYLNKRIALLKTENKGLMNCYSEMKQSSHFNKDSYEAKTIRKQIWTRCTKIMELIEEKGEIQNRMDKIIAERAVSAKHLDRHRNKIQLKGKED